MSAATVPELKDFRKEAIANLEELKSSYMNLIKSGDDADEKPRIDRLERAVRLLPGLLKTEEGLLSSVEDTERRRQLEESLEPLFTVLRRVLGSEFDTKREDILAALEAELKNNGS